MVPPNPPSSPWLPPEFASPVLIGTGSFGQVWRAVHRDWGVVAVKVLAPGRRDDPEANWRFSGEHRRLAALDQAAVPRLHGIGLTGEGAPYYAMTFSPGEPPLGPWPTARVRRVLGALAGILAEVHAAGLTHGDLKAENVLVTVGDRVSLIDFAGSMAIGSPRDGLDGTLTHLAPEAWRGAAHAPEADWYALGVLGHRLWTGRLPFDGGLAALARAHAHEPAPPIDTEEDPGLARAIATLLAKDPAARLEGVAALGVTARAPAGLRPAEGPTPPLADEAWAQALAAGGTAWLVGPTGAGKSRVLDGWRLRAAGAGKPWFAVRAAGAVTGATVRALVSRVLAGAGLAEGPSRAWCAGEIPAAWTELEPRARLAALAGMLAMDLATAFERLGGAVLVVDDWARCDEASEALLRDLRQRPALSAVTWVFATDGAAPEGEANITLTPWPPEALRELATARLGAPLPTALLPWVEAISWPGDLLQALARWVAVGALSRGADGWHVVADLKDAGAMAPPPGAAGLAALVAVAGRAGGLPLAALPAAAGTGWEAALDQLVAAGWARVRDGFVRPVDPREAARGAGSLAGDRELAGGLARAIMATGGPVAIAARLAVASGDAALALPLVRDAAADALEQLAAQAALDLLLAAPAALDDDLRLSLARLRGEACRLADRLDEAIAAYDEVIPLADAKGEALVAARARIGRAKVQQMRGRYAPALDDAITAERVALPVAPLVAARAAVAQARIHNFQGDTLRALTAVRRAVALAREGEGSGAGPVLAAALNLEGALIAADDPAAAPVARAKLAEALALTEAAGDRLGHAAALENLGNVHLATGDLPAARDAFSAYEAACAEAQAPTERLSGAMNRALALAALGDPAAAALGAATAHEALVRGRPFVVALARLAEGEAAWRAGHWAAAWASFDEALACALETGNRYAESLVRIARLDAAAALAEPARLAGELEGVAALVNTVPSPELRAAVALARARVALLDGRPDDATALAGPHAGAVNRAVALKALLLLGDAALARGDREGAGERFEAARAIADAWGARWHREAAWLALARAGGPQRAEAWLARVLDGDHASEGNPVARAAAASLRLAAGRAPGPLGEAALAALDATALRRPAASAIAPAAVAPWLAAIGLADDEDALHEALLGALLDLAAMTRGYLLGYEGGRLARIATRSVDFAEELAEGFSTTIADEALITGEPVYEVDAAGTERFRSAASVVALGLRSVVALPFATTTTILGVAYADRTAVDPTLSPTDLVLLQTLATCAAERALGLRARAALAEATRWRDGVAALASACAVSPEPARRACALAGLTALAGAMSGAWLRQAPDGWQPVTTLGVQAEGGWKHLIPVPGRPEALAFDWTVGEAPQSPEASAQLAGAIGALAPWLGPIAGG